MSLDTPASRPHDRPQRTPQNSISIAADYPTILASLRGLAFPVIAPPEPLFMPLSRLISSLKLHPILEAALHIRNMDIASARPLLQNLSGSAKVSGYLEGKLLEAISFRLEGNMARAKLGYNEAYEVAMDKERKRETEGQHQRQDSQMQDQHEQRQAQYRQQNSDCILCSVWGKAEDRDVSGVNADSSGPGGSDGISVLKQALDKARDRAVAFTGSLEDWRERAGSVAEEMELGEQGSREWERVVMLCERRFGTGMWANAGAELMKADARMRAGEALVRVGDGF